MSVEGRFFVDASAIILAVAEDGLHSSGGRVPASHCWTSQQWHPKFYFKSTVQYALSRKFFQLAYFGLPSLIVSIGLRFGRTGF